MVARRRRINGSSCLTALVRFFSLLLFAVVSSRRPGDFPPTGGKIPQKPQKIPPKTPFSRRISSAHRHATGEFSAIHRRAVTLYCAPRHDRVATFLAFPSERPGGQASRRAVGQVALKRQLFAPPPPHCRPHCGERRPALRAGSPATGCSIGQLSAAASTAAPLPPAAGAHKILYCVMPLERAMLMT